MTDTYEKEVFQIGSGFGFRIRRNGAVENEQPHKPGIQGIVHMTEDEANQIADEIIALKENPPMPPTVIEFEKLLTDAQKITVTNALKGLKLAHSMR